MSLIALRARRCLKGSLAASPPGRTVHLRVLFIQVESWLEPMLGGKAGFGAEDVPADVGPGVVAAGGKLGLPLSREGHSEQIFSHAASSEVPVMARAPSPLTVSILTMLPVTVSEWEGNMIRMCAPR